MNRLRAEFRGLRITDRGRLALDAAMMLGGIAAVYLIICLLFPWCAS